MLSKGRYQSLFVFSRLFSSKKYEKIEGIQEKFNEYEVRLHFDKWLKSLWLAPNQWVHSTRDRSLNITRRFLPFWNITFNGSLEFKYGIKKNFPFQHEEKYYSHREWHSLPLEIKDISLNNINIYAAENVDRYHIQKLDVSFDDVQLVDLTNKNNIIEEPTINQETAFNHAWILIIKPLLENMCLQQVKKKHPGFDDIRIDSFHLKINSIEENLLYYPIYTINYKYNSPSNYICLFDGVTGHIAGDRQYSIIKVTFATLIGFYPMVKIGFFCFGSLANLLFAFEIASDISFSVIFPFALIIAPCVGYYAYSHPKKYKQYLSEVQWNRDQFKSSNFTYDFIDSFQQKKKQLDKDDDQTIIDISDDIDSDQKIKNTKKYDRHSNLIVKKVKKEDD